ncbi:MAG: hypothetical protein ACTSYA_04805 [Candidatus Kariarchaeaceae archaeon]
MSDNFISINQLNMKNKSVMTRFKVIEVIDEPKEVISKRNQDKNNVAVFKVADETGCINLTVWNEVIEQMILEQSFKLINGFCSAFKQHLTLNVGKEGKIEPLNSEEKVIAETNLENNLSEPIIQRRKEKRRETSRYKRRDPDDWSSIDDVSIRSADFAARKKRRY